MRAGAQRDDPRLERGGERVVEADGEGEVPEMVGGELHLPALGGVRLGHGHDPRVVDQQV